MLRKRASGFKKIIDANPDLVESVVASLNGKKIKASTLNSMPVVTAYILVLWALDGKNQGQGFGFPFDRPYLTCYQRLQEMYSALDKLYSINFSGNRRDNKPYGKILRDLYDVMNDATLRKTAIQMEEKTQVFDKLREAMRIALPDEHLGLNDDGDHTDIRTIEKGVKDFYEWLCHDDARSKNHEYKGMIAQIEKYWDKLFADPITVDTPHGKITIQPQRTNNILERFFRDIKRKNRKKSGTNSLSKTLKAMLADTPLVKNLENQNYMNMILNGKESLEERFAEMDANIVRQELMKIQNDSEKISPKIKKVIKEPKLLETLVALFAG